MYGVNPLTLFLIPILFDKHPDDLPRFRDSHLRKIDKDQDNYEIEVLSRVGKKYHGEGYGEELYFDHPNFIRFENKLITKDFQDDTYGRYYFTIPDQYVEDVMKMLKGSPENTTVEFKTLVCKTFPKLKSMLSELFGIFHTVEDEENPV